MIQEKLNVRLNIIMTVFGGRKFIAEFTQDVMNPNCPKMEHILIDCESADGMLHI